MKQIVNYEESLKVFKDYISNNISDNSINELIQAFQHIQDLELEMFKIENSNDINDIFLMPPDKIRELANDLKKNNQYITALKVAKEYAKLKKEEDKQNFNFQNFQKDIIDNLSIIIKNFETFYNNFISSDNKNIVADGNFYNFIQI